MATHTSPQSSEAPAVDVFISYGGADKDMAARMRQALLDVGLTSWVAFVDIPPGAKYAERIVSGLQRCRAVAVLVSEASMASEHVFREIAEAASLGKTLLPIYLAPDVRLPQGVLYYLAPLHRLKVEQGDIEACARRVAAALADPGAWQREALPPPWLPRLRASPFRWAGLGLAVTVLGGLVVWGAQSLWQRHASDQALEQADSLPATLGLVQVLDAEREAVATAAEGVWQLRLTVTLGSDRIAYRAVTLLVRSGGGSAAGDDEVFDVTRWIRADQVGGGQSLSGPLPRLGEHVVVCLRLPHPRTGSAWRLTTAFSGQTTTSAAGQQRIIYAPAGAPRAAPEDASPCA